MKKKTKLHICNRMLLAVGLIVLLSSICIEADGDSSAAWIWLQNRE
ncbi:MAG: hypothetical protein NC388_02070 [Clostridium sp.]|nr:hypothetical protein [Clostridium sp.]